MHDLEKKIAEWRRNMAKSPGQRAEALDELEAHLREEIERLSRTGSSPERAFELAVVSLGSAGALGAEFQKLEQMRRAKWKPATFAQWACVAVGILAAVAILPRIGQGRMTVLLTSHVLTVTIGFSTMFIVGGLATCYVFAEWFQKTGPSQRYALHRTVVQLATVATILNAAGTVLGMLWAKQNWDRYWAWDPKETSAVLILGCGLALLAARWFKPASCNAIIIMGILGSACTAVGWFGVNESMRVHPLVIAFLAGHCLVLLAFSARWMRKQESLS